MSNDNTLLVFANYLFDNGLKPLPLQGKRPITPNWEDLSNRPKPNGEFESATSVGVALGQRTERGILIALDFDVRDKDTIKPLYNYLIEKLGNFPVRVGAPPKFLVPLFLSDVDIFKKTTTPWMVKDGLKDRIEVLAQGQQAALIGKHPSGVDYKWFFSEFRIEALPVIKVDDLNEILERSVAIMGQAGYGIERPIREAPVPVIPTLVAASEVLAETSDYEVRDILTYIWADDYDDWIRVGMALKASFGDRAFEIWDEWSRTSSKYEKSVMAAKWQSFKGDEIKWPSVCHLAELQGASLQDIAREYRRKGSVIQEAFSDADFEAMDAEMEEAKAPKRHPFRQVVIPKNGVMDAPKFVVDNLIQSGFVSIAGMTGLGKTTVLAPIAAEIAGVVAGDIGVHARLKRHVYYVGEDIGQIERIIEAMRIKGVITMSWPEISKTFHMVNARRLPALAIARLAAEVADDYLDNTINGITKPMAPLFIFDTTNATIRLENENDNSEVGDAVSILRNSLRDINIWLIGHTPKTARTDFSMVSTRGAGAWTADTQQNILLAEENGVRYFILAKKRFETDHIEFLIESEIADIEVVDEFDVRSTVTARFARLSHLEGGVQAAREEQKEAKRSDKADQNKARMANDIHKFLTENGPHSLRQIRKNVKGGNDAIGEVVDEMVDAKSLVLNDQNQYEARSDYQQITEHF